MSKLDKIYLKSGYCLQNIFLSSYGLYRNKLFRRSRSYDEAVRELEVVEWEDARGIEEYQNRMLSRIISHCYRNAPFYRQVMDENGITPPSKGSIDRDWLKKMPVIDKNQVQRNWDKFQSSRKELLVMKGATSGTTGTGLSLRLSEEVVGYERAAIDRYRARAGYVVGDRVASFTGRTLKSPNDQSPPFWRYNWADRQMLFSYWHVSDDTLPYYVEAYNGFAPDFAHGYPSFLYLVAEFCLRKGLQLHSPRGIFTSSETLHDWQRSVIEEAFGGRILDRYGCAEKVVSAAQCEEGNYHVDAELGILEIIDGEAVATTLHNFAMPLIRYRLGDILEWEEHSCSCGRGLPVIKQPEGRVEDVLIAPDGRKFGRLDHIFKAREEIREAQIVQTEVSKIMIRVAPCYEGAVTRKEIEGMVREKLGNAFVVEIEFVERVPREKNGKFRFVKSEIAA